MAPSLALFKNCLDDVYSAVLLLVDSAVTLKAAILIDVNSLLVLLNFATARKSGNILFSATLKALLAVV